MGAVGKSAATLRIYGDDLDPDEVTRVLGREPTLAHRKGDFRRSKTVWHTGGWSLEARDREPEDLNAQIFELFDLLTSHPEVWLSLKQRFKMDLFVGLFMAESNDGVVISSEALSALGNRGIELQLDIYDPIKEPVEEAQL